MRRACDFLVDRFVIKDPAPEVRTLLRLGALQLGFAGVDAHAAVSTTVDLAPPRAGGSSTPCSATSPGRRRRGPTTRRG